jgi:hypothetical protein
MKNWTVAKWSFGLALAALPLVGGCVQESANPAPAIVTATNQNSANGSAEVAGAPAPAAAEQDLESAPGTIVSLADPPMQTANLTPSAAEVARLAQSGLEENVMLAFVTNSASAFNLGSDQIIYLNDIGVPGNVVTSMIQHDQVLKPGSPVPVVTRSVAVNLPVPAAPPEPVESQLPPVVADGAPPQANVSSTYFQDSLSPYGNWIDIEGYGQCWQPSVVVVNRSWTPYCNGGRWVYSDCGWYWASDYSWGWAPFHYGRWFRHNFWGWCWAPDTVWGPAWVSWRYNPGYCGWAPLPPTACYRPGFGFTYCGNSVSASFGFGLGANCFTFVSVGNFCNPQPYRHCVPPQHVTQIFNNTTIINPVVEGHGNSHFHKGIPVERIAEVTHTEIKPVRIHETTDVPRNDRGEQFDRNNGTLTVFRPRLPEPPANHSGTRVGEGVKPATPDNGGVLRFSTDTTMHKGIPRQSSGAINSPPADRRNDNVPVFKVPAVSPKPGDMRSSGSTEVARTTPAFGNSQPRSTREIENTSASSNGKEIPPNSLILRGRPDTAAQAKLDTPASSVILPPVERNNSLLNRRPQQFNVPQPQTGTATSPQNQYGGRGQQIPRPETPRYQPRDERVFSPPTAPVQRQQDVRIYQAPPVTPREQRGSYNPVPERSVPTAPAAARVEAPRVEMRQAPAAQAPQPSVQGGGNNARQNR